MIHLGPNEKILMVLRRHWVVIVGKFFIGFLFLLLPIILLPLLGAASNHFNVSLAPYIQFSFVVYLLVIALVLFLFWIDYYLDVWIITNERIVDIEQHSLFNREISEIMLSRVQDITIEIPDMLATFLKYGNIIIKTAGESAFSIRQVSKIYEAKNLILDYSLNAAKNSNVGAL